MTPTRSAMPSYLVMGIVFSILRKYIRKASPLWLLCTQGFLGTAFLVEGILFAFHLKGSSLDKSLHVLLVLLVFAAALACYAEMR